MEGTMEDEWEDGVVTCVYVWMYMKQKGSDDEARKLVPNNN